MAAQQEPIILTDGSLDWSLGVNSIKPTTVASKLNPSGLARNELAWLDNGTVREGGITQRFGWTNLGALPIDGPYMGSAIYSPEYGNPYLLTVIDGHVIQINPDVPDLAVDLSVKFNLYFPVTPRVYFCEAQQFMVIQGGDYGNPVWAPKSGTTDAQGQSLPLFWDGSKLWRSQGITTKTAAPGTPGVNGIPAALSMIYYLGRIWYAQGQTVSAGDIVFGPSGTAPYDLADSILNVTENPLCTGGDGFAVPTSAGNIRGLSYSANLNALLGQSNLYIGTPGEVYQLQVPVTRADWIGADINNAPLMTVAIVGIGWVSDRSIVQANSDLFFQTLEPAIRSLALAIRNFGQWGNVPISINEYRVLQYNDRALLQFSSGIQFDNRLLQTALPYTCPVGTAHKAIVPLNFDIISSLEGQVSASTGVLTSYPAWEGMWEGLNWLELLQEQFGGLPRAFGLVWSDLNQAIELWELTTDQKFDNVSSRVVWYFETQAFTFEKETSLKKLVSGELWLDSLWGEAIVKIEYRPDGFACWLAWYEFKVCTEADPEPEPAYPQGINRQSYRQMISLPVPPADCSSPMGRPSNVGYQFQCRMTIKGYCRIRGLFLHAEPVDRRLYSNMITC